jgi:hypothetical protein
MSLSVPKRTMEFILKLRSAASENDMQTIKNTMNDSGYCIAYGKEAIGISLSRNYNNITYELLAYPGALDEFFNSPFKVDNGCRQKVSEYINMKNNMKNKY